MAGTDQGHSFVEAALWSAEARFRFLAGWAKEQPLGQSKEASLAAGGLAGSSLVDERSQGQSGSTPPS